jgi:hypothetical protein
MLHRGQPPLRTAFFYACTVASLWLGATGSRAWSQEGTGADAETLPAFASAVDAASAMAGRARRHLGKSAIQLSPPVVEGALLSQVAYVLPVPTGYAGTGLLQYSMVTAPAGMTIDAEAGLVRWTPPAPAEGTQVDVRVRATDGTATGEVAFTLRVAAPQPMTTSLAGSLLSVTQPGSLQGLTLAFPAQTTPPPAQVAVATVAPGDAPPIPAGVTRISDFFRATPLQGESGLITITLPVASLPPGRRAEDVRLFVYSDVAADAGAEGVIEQLTWVPTWLGFDVLPGGKVAVRLQGLGDLSFVGVEALAQPTPAAAASPAVGTLRVGAASASYACSPFVPSDGLPSTGIEVCGITGDVTMNVVVKHFSKLKTTPATTRNELLGWLVAGRASFTALGLSADDSLEVVVEKMPEANVLGFVTMRNLENRGTLHLSAARLSKPLMQAAAVHEYFHHAQSRTSVAGKTNVVDFPPDGLWLTEGTAMWFQDEVFDSLDSYRDIEREPLAQIALKGVAAVPREGIRGTRSYTRFAFFKMVSSSCPGFALPEILNFDTSDYSRGLANLKAAVESAPWACDFGSGFGYSNRATLASALLSYTYATVKRDDLSFLDANEPYFGFEGIGEEQKLAPSAGCPSFATCPAGAMRSSNAVPGAATAYQVLGGASLGPGQGAILEVKSVAGREVWVWVGEADKAGGLADGTWAKTTSSWTHVYATGGSAPALDVIVVNPTSSGVLDYQIRAAIGGATVSFEGSLVDAPTFFEGPLFTISASGTVTGPLGTTVEEPAPEAWYADHGLRFSASVPNLPARIVISGEFDAQPDKPSGRYDYEDGSYYEWSLSNRRFAGDAGCGPGPDFTFVISEEVTWDTNRNCDVLWEYDYGWYDKDGKRTRGGSGEGAFGVLMVDIVRQP